MKNTIQKVAEKIGKEYIMDMTSIVTTELVQQVERYELTEGYNEADLVNSIADNLINLSLLAESLGIREKCDRAIASKSEKLGREV